MTDAAATDFRALINKRAKGKRPKFFDDPDTERLLGIFMALTMEVAVLRERLDTVERVLESKGAISRQDIEGYDPDPAAADQRARTQQLFLTRVLRIVDQEIEALGSIGEEDLETIADRMRTSEPAQ